MINHSCLLPDNHSPFPTYAKKKQVGSFPETFDRTQEVNPKRNIYLELTYAKDRWISVDNRWITWLLSFRSKVLRESQTQLKVI